MFSDTSISEIGHYLCIELPLYQAVAITKEEIPNLNKFFKERSSFDGYNPKIDERTTYVSIQQPQIKPFNSILTGNQAIVMSFTCQRKKNTFQAVFTGNKLDDDKYEIIKIGQYPKYENFKTNDLKNIQMHLNKNDMDDYYAAQSLFSLNYGAGGFLYLRRVLESLISQVHKTKRSQSEWDQKDYLNKNPKDYMEGKIKYLTRDLPDALIQNKVAWKILSSGVHELSDEECSKHFPVINRLILLILEQYIRDKNEKELMLKLDKAISQTQNDIMNKS